MCYVFQYFYSWKLLAAFFHLKMKALFPSIIFSWLFFLRERMGVTCLLRTVSSVGVLSFFFSPCCPNLLSAVLFSVWVCCLHADVFFLGAPFFRNFLRSFYTVHFSDYVWILWNVTMGDSNANLPVSISVPRKIWYCPLYVCLAAVKYCRTLLSLV